MTFKQMLLTVDRMADLPGHELLAADVPSFLANDPLLKSRFYSMLKDPSGLQFIQKHQLWPNADNPVEAVPFLNLLARFAKAEESAAVDGLTRIVETSEPRVQMHALELLAKLPASVCIPLLPQIKAWLEKSPTLFLHEGIAKLISHFASAQLTSEALDLALTCLAFRKSPSSDSGDEKVRSRWDVYEFKTILDEGVRKLGKVEPIKTFQVCCDTLDMAVQLAWADENGSIKPTDHSHWWRAAIEEHEQNHEFRQTELLVPVIRDIAEEAIANNADHFCAIAARLQSYRWDIFLRLLIHLYRQYPMLAGERVRSILMNRELFFDDRVLHEWYGLLKERFKYLSEQDQKQILTWIETDFDEKRFIESCIQFNGKSPTPEQIDLSRRHAHLRKLSAIASDLPPNNRAYYESLVRDLGEPDHPDFLSWGGSVETDGSSPKSSDELGQMVFSDLFKFLGTFKPSAKPFSLELEGLAGALELAAKRNSERFDADLTCLMHLRPLFARSVMRGLTEAAVEKRDIPLQRLLGLLFSIAAHSIDESRKEELWEKDLDGLQLEAARSVRKLLSAEQPVLSLELRDSVWKVVERLTEARNPTTDYEGKYSNGRKFATLSLNTTRGEAMHALFSYAMWVRRLLGAQTQHNPATEILDVLSKRLDPAVETTFTIRAIYGEKLGWLNYFHPEWVNANAGRIFPLEPKFAEFRRVAWDTFVTFSRPSIGLFELLETEYREAVARLSSGVSAENEHDVERPEEALSHHLLALFWWGRMPIDDSASLLSEFFRVAPPKLRAHAIDYAGRSVKNTETVPPEIIERLQHLYDSRLRAARQSRNRWEYEEELAALGSWVWSGKFQPKWLLDRLQEMLAFVGELKRFGMYILEELSDLSETYPLETVRCLELIVTKENHRLSWHAKPETVRTILENARKSNSELAHTIASLVEDHLLRKGWFEYLTPEKTASSA